MRYAIRWFKCKLKPPNNLEHRLAIMSNKLSPQCLGIIFSISSLLLTPYGGINETKKWVHMLKLLLQSCPQYHPHDSL